MNDFLAALGRWFSEKSFSVIDVMVYGSVLVATQGNTFQLVIVVGAIWLAMGASAIIRKVSGA